MMGRATLNKGRLQAMVPALLILAMMLCLMPPLAVRNGAYQLYRAAAWQKVRWERRGMLAAGSGLVRVYHDGSDEQSADLVVALLEQYAAQVEQNYGYLNRQPVQVVIHPSRRSLAASMGWASGESALGVYWGGSIKLLSPSVWLTGKSQQEIESVYRQSGPVVHEYTHLVVDQMTSGNIPRWLTEGLAQVEEQRLTGYLWLERGSAIKDGNLYALAQMGGDFDGLSNQPLAYHQSYTMARYLLESEGQQQVNRVLRELGTGYTLDQALERVTGSTLAEFEDNWRAWVLNEYRVEAS